MTYHLKDSARVVQFFAPASNSSNMASDVILLRDYAQANLLLQLGGSTVAGVFTLYNADDTTPSTTTAIAFNYFYTTQAASDTFTTQYVATTTGITFGGTTNTQLWAVVNVAELSTNYPGLYATYTGSTGNTMCGVAVLTGPRYKGTLISAN